MNIHIEILNQKALKLLHDLEELNLIKVIEEENGHSKTIEKKEDKLSKKFAGKLKNLKSNKEIKDDLAPASSFIGTLSKKEAKKLLSYIEKSRKEWERDI
ncbi:MAG: hypothetical protein N3F62_03215 [Bacteroidia bacterium]|jgi:hypothetical protein|nr:hypothetical protein [Bacteroidia bacterium]